MIMELKGMSGRLQLYEDKVIFSRKSIGGKLTHGFTKGDKTIYLSQISGIEMKLGGLINGYISLSLAGGNEKRGSAFKKVQNDDNSLIFTSIQNKVAKAMKEKIEELQRNPIQPENSFSVADELIKFNQLLETGVITQEEFDNKKQKLLNA